METVCQPSYPLNSENASPFGTRTVYLAWAVSCAEVALPPRTASTVTARETTMITTAGILLLFIAPLLVFCFWPVGWAFGLKMVLFRSDIASPGAAEGRPAARSASRRTMARTGSPRLRSNSRSRFARPRRVDRRPGYEDRSVIGHAISVLHPGIGATVGYIRPPTGKKRLGDDTSDLSPPSRRAARSRRRCRARGIDAVV